MNYSQLQETVNEKTKNQDFDIKIKKHKFTDSPYKEIPEQLKNNYSLNGMIPIKEWWINGSKKETVKWNDEMINEYKERYTVDKIFNNAEGKSPYGNGSCRCLLESFLKYNITNKNVAVVGSETPWIEAMLINLNNKVTTIEYNVPESNFENLECKDYFNFFVSNKEQFDVIVTYSSIEHSGLGRYGDPLDPNGDFETMDVIHQNLKDDGVLIWGSPVGHDALVWNAHRVYGPIRLPILFSRFMELEWIGANKEILLSQPLRDNGPQPVVVLVKRNEKKLPLINFIENQGVFIEE